jgi:hypothetical protein
MNSNYSQNGIDPNGVLPGGAIITTNLGQYVASPNQHFVIQQQQAGENNQAGSNANGSNSASANNGSANPVENGSMPIAASYHPNSYIISTGGSANPNANPNIVNAFNAYQYAAAYGGLNQTGQQMQQNAGIYQANNAQIHATNMHASQANANSNSKCSRF